MAGGNNGRGNASAEDHHSSTATPGGVERVFFFMTIKHMYLIFASETLFVDEGHTMYAIADQADRDTFISRTQCGSTVHSHRDSAKGSMDS